MKTKKKGRAKAPRLTEAQCKMVEANIGLVGYAIAQFGSYHLDCDDAFQVGTIGLIRAVMKHDQARGAFSTFAMRCIRNELRRESQRQLRPHRHYGLVFVSLDAPFPGDEDSNDPWRLVDIHDDTQISVEEHVMLADLVERASAHLASADGQPAKIAVDYLTSDMTQLEVANKYGVSQAQVSAYVRQMTRQIRKQAGIGVGHKEAFS